MELGKGPGVGQVLCSANPSLRPQGGGGRVVVPHVVRKGEGDDEQEDGGRRGLVNAEFPMLARGYARGRDRQKKGRLWHFTGQKLSEIYKLPSQAA